MLNINDMHMYYLQAILQLECTLIVDRKFHCIHKCGVPVDHHRWLFHILVSFFEAACLILALSQHMKGWKCRGPAAHEFFLYYTKGPQYCGNKDHIGILGSPNPPRPFCHLIYEYAVHSSACWINITWEKERHHAKARIVALRGHGLRPLDQSLLQTWCKWKVKYLNW